MKRGDFNGCVCLLLHINSVVLNFNLKARTWRGLQQFSNKTRDWQAPPFNIMWPQFNVMRVLTYGLHPTLFMWPFTFMWLTADGKERVRLLSLHRSHTFQSIEPSPADVHPTLHLCLPKHGAEERNGDDIVFLLGSIHLLGAPEGRRLYIVNKRLTGSLSYSSIVPCQDTQAFLT